MQLSIFSRLAIGLLTIVLMAIAVNAFALYQIRQITAQTTAIAAIHYPAIDGMKWLIASLYAQERSEMQYLAVHDEVFRRHFERDAEDFQRLLASLRNQESSTEAGEALAKAEKLHAAYRALFQEAASRRFSVTASQYKTYEARSNDLVEDISKALQSDLDFHERRLGEAMKEVLQRAGQSQDMTTQLTVAALIVGIGLAAFTTYSILKPLRRLQEHILEIGRGNFRASVDVAAPSDLRDLVESVRSMGRRLQEIDDRKAEFVSHVTHELRSPMTAIHAGAQFLLEEIPGPVTKHQRDALQLMAESSRQLIQMVSSLLDLSKIEAGMMEYHITPVDLLRNVHVSVNKVKLLAERENIRIVVETPSGPASVAADDARIQQVLDNLLSNALKFSRRGSTIRVRLECDKNSNIMRISVCDTGRGIPPESLPHIFEQFYQGSLPVKSNVPGSGIGLALVKKVVEAHGGKVWAESELGKGTTMNLILPLAS